MLLDVAWLSIGGCWVVMVAVGFLDAVGWLDAVASHALAQSSKSQLITNKPALSNTIQNVPSMQCIFIRASTSHIAFVSPLSVSMASGVGWCLMLWMLWVLLDVAWCWMLLSVGGCWVVMVATGFLDAVGFVGCCCITCIGSSIIQITTDHKYKRSYCNRGPYKKDK